MLDHSITQHTKKTFLTKYRNTTAYQKYVKTTKISKGLYKSIYNTKKAHKEIANQTFMPRYVTRQEDNSLRKETKSVLEAHDKSVVNKKVANKDIRIYRGSFSLPCVSMKSALELLEEINKALSLHNVKSKKINEYLLNCERQGIKFEMEIMQMEGVESMNIIRFKRLEGSVGDYKVLCSKLLSSMRLSLQ